jgi:serine/alanine adding enzyme
MTMSTSLVNVHRGHPLPADLPSPDVYFLSGYGQAACRVSGGEWVLLEAYDGAWQVPLVIRTMSDGTQDATSPYGYSGVYASPSLSRTQVDEAWLGTVGRLRELGIVSVLLRHSSLVPQAPDLPGLRPVIGHHPTILLEPADGDSAWSGLQGDCRTKVRKALKNGYSGYVREAKAEDLAPDSDFRRLYDHTMQRLVAAPGYLFGDDYYTELLAGLGSNLYLAEVRDQAGHIATSGLLMRHGQRLHGHLTGSHEDAARMGSNNLMIWTSTQFAVERGLCQFHLGGGVSAQDGLYKFKRSFGGRELEYRVSGLVLDDERYQSKVQDRASECEITTDSLLAASYFPAYRGGNVLV